jgi:putative hydrolase of the HAD superfamily
MPVSEPRAVIFDLDDTLYPEREFVMSGYATVARWCGRMLGLDAQWCQERLRSIYDTPDRARAFDKLLELARPERPEGVELTHDQARDAVQKMIAVYRCHRPSLHPFPGVPELLSRLGAILPLGLVSDGELTMQERKLDALGLAEIFDTVVFSDALGREHWKPSPRPLLEAAAHMGCDPAGVVYVADNPAKDFLAARRAGMQGWRLRPEGGVYAHLEPETPEHAPHREISDLQAVEDLVLTP